MDKPLKFVLPSPNFDKNTKDLCKTKPHYLTPSGMSLLPREKQPPPMYGKHGPTLPPIYLKNHLKEQQFAPLCTLIAPEKQYCEPCELELNSLEDLKRHRSQHENCPVEGCHYKGHPSVMDKHINALHSSGLFDKFKRLSTPEEIAAWRDERRKRYPTLANVLLKQKAKEQKQKRGERLESSRTRFGNANDRKRAQSNVGVDKDEKNRCGENTSIHKNNKRSRKNKHKKAKNQQELKPKEQNEKQTSKKLPEDDVSNCDGIKMFRGTCQLKNYEHLKDRKKKVKNNILYGLVGMYGSDDDESDEDDDDEYNLNKTKLANIDAINHNHIDTSLEKQSKQLVNDENKKIPEISLGNESIEMCILKRETFSKSTNSDDIESVEHIKKSAESCPAKNTANSINNEQIEQDTSNQNDHSCDEAPEETPIQRCYPEISLISGDIPKRVPIDKQEISSKQKEQTIIPKQKKNIKRKSGLDYRKARLRKQNTMLEKLLESDIRHERNVLLQCVRFVCENNFFEIGVNKNQDSEINEL